MQRKDTLDSRLLAWARTTFAEEVNSGFIRARAFDGFHARCSLDALARMPDNTLPLLAVALPLGVGFERDAARAALNALPLDQQQAVRRFIATRAQIYNERAAERWSRIDRRRDKSLKPEIREIRKTGIAVAKEFAAQWGYKAEKIEPALWRLSCRKKWGELSLQWDLETPFEFLYVLFIYDGAGLPLRSHSGYMETLGIGGSDWSIASAERCREKLQKAGEIVWWHLNEYEKIMDSLAT